MKNSIWIILLFVSVSGGACMAQSEPTSLADVAKQQKSDKKATLVLSDDDKPASFSSGPDTTSTGSSQTTDANANAGQKSSDAKAIDSKRSSKDEGSSKDNLKKQLDSYKAEQDTWKASAKRYDDLLSTEQDDFRRQMDQEALDNDKKNIAFYQQKIDQTQAALNSAQKSAGSQSTGNTSAPGSH